MTPVEPPRPRRNPLVPWTLAVIGVLATVGMGLRPRGGDSPEPALRTVDLTGQPTLGATDAPVRVLIFADFKCPFCRQLDLEVLPRLRQDFVSRGQVRVTFVNLAFLGEDSVTAAMAGECVVEQDPRWFFPYASALYRAQGDERSPWATEDLLVRTALDVEGVDPNQLRSCLSARATRERVLADQTLARKLKVTGTPTVFVNDVRVARYDYRHLSRRVREALE